MASAIPTRALKASMVLAFFVGGCAAAPEPQPVAPTDFTTISLPGADGSVVRALQRAERTAPLRYRVIVVPGSGCAGMGPLADRYFAGLLHAEVLVLHKPGVDPGARTAAGACPAGFLQADRLSAWRDHARAALQADARQRRAQGLPAVPQVLVGISEGSELLPALAAEVPGLAGLVLLSGSALDPREAGALQAQRLGVSADWEALGRQRAGSQGDGAVVQGRSLGYWRDLWHWPLARPLRDGPWPVLQVWGGADALVPAEAFRRGAQQAQGRQAPWCARELPGADHGLQGPGGHDGVQQLWAWLEQWGRAQQLGLCAPLKR